MTDRHILYKIQPAIAGEFVVDAADTEVDDTTHTGILANVNDVNAALGRIDNTGIGAQPRTFTGSFLASYGELGNQDIWYGGRQTVILEGARGQSNGNYVFEIPDIDELTAMFDDLESRNLGQVYTVTIGYQGGSSTSIVRNSLTIRAPSVSALFSGLPVTIGQGTSVTLRIDRIAGNIGSWERLSIAQAVDPVATFGEVVIQALGWNNSDSSFLPPSSAVLKGYAFPVIGSNPNDGTLRQGLLDSGVSDRVIYDGDYVVWTADAFTAWTDGGNWFVLSRNDLQRMSREQSNFLAQTLEIDTRVDVAPVAQLTSDALVWVSENPLAEAPFLTPSDDTNNPRSGDDYAYVGGRENRNDMSQFQFGQNRFNSYLTIGISPNFITGHPESDIHVRIYDDQRNVLNDFNLATDFVFTDDATFTNSTVRHYVRNTSVNYPFLATIEIWLTRADEHFRLNPQTVDVTPNVQNLTEDQLSSDVQDKLNRALPPQDMDFSSIEERLSPYATLTNRSPDHDARFFSASASAAYPSDLSDFNSVSANNPRFTASDVVLFVATPEPGSFGLTNITTGSIVALDQSEPIVDVVESLSVSGVTYFVYRVTGITSGHVFEVERTTTERVVAWANDLDNLQDDIDRIDAELSHAALNLPDALVQVLENEVSVTEEDKPTVIATAYNIGLASGSGQKVFYETNPNAPSGGVLASKPFSDLSGDRVRRKLMYLPSGTTYANQAYLTAFDGTTGRELIRYVNGVFNAKVFVPAKSATSSEETIYPAPSTRVSGAGIWINIPALTFINGVPVPEADEVFFTRNIPTTATELTIDYRGHANGNVFGTGSTTLDNVGGGSDAFANFTLNAGSESASVEVRWSASDRNIRVSVTEHVNAGLPTINDIEVILSWKETRTIPSTPATTRDVPLEYEHPQGQVFAIKPSPTGSLILVGDRAEIDMGYSYATLFGAGETGHLITPVEQATYLNYEDFEPITTTVTDLENHATLPQFGLFTTEYTHATIVGLDTQLTVRDASGKLRNVGDVLSDLLTRVTALEP